MVDIYRRARSLVQTPGVNKISVQNAVDVARWIPYIPIMDRTPYGTVKLIWQYGQAFVSFEFVPGAVKIVMSVRGNVAQLFEGTQHFDKNIPLDILCIMISQFALAAGLPSFVPKPWDKNAGVPIEEIDMEKISKLEAAGNAARIQAFFEQEDEEDTAEESEETP